MVAGVRRGEVGVVLVDIHARKGAGMEGKLNGNHLRLISWLCLEDRTNY